jgi:hypothetical protein
LLVVFVAPLLLSTTAAAAAGHAAWFWLMVHWREPWQLQEQL